MDGPYTAVVVGAGCSMSLGVPTMPTFMDEVFSRLAEAEDPNDRERLQIIREFLQRIKPAGAYLSTRMLNIEELYGMADMAWDLSSTGQKVVSSQCDDSSWRKKGGTYGARLAYCTRHVLNLAIHRIAIGAGEEFLTDPDRFPKLREIETVKRESATETLQVWDQGSKYTNLLAYLCLASHQDRDGTHPLFIQFNWDLALDRALYFLHRDGLCGEAHQVLPEKGWLPPWYEPPEHHAYYECPRVARPHGGLCWVDTERSERKTNGLRELEKKLEKQRCVRLREKLGSRRWNTDIWIDPTPIWDPKHNEDPKRDLWSAGQYMAIVPPTWRKQSTKPAYQDQWSWIKEGLKSVRRLVFIGYSLPRTDLYFRHFLALALATNDYSPKIYVWNPGIFDKPEVRDSYLDLFAPLAREGRLFGIDGYFGNPALFDLERACNTARPLNSVNQ